MQTTLNADVRQEVPPARHFFRAVVVAHGAASVITVEPAMPRRTTKSLRTSPDIDACQIFLKHVGMLAGAEEMPDIGLAGLVRHRQ
jgi:hypothetical protein